MSMSTVLFDRKAYLEPCLLIILAILHLKFLRVL